MHQILAATTYSQQMLQNAPYASSQGPLPALTNINSLSDRLLSMGTVAIYFLTSLAVLFIVWNTVMYFIRSNDGKARTAALQSIVWGLTGLAIIVSIWGLVALITNTFNVSAPTDQKLPGFLTTQGKN